MGSNITHMGRWQLIRQITQSWAGDIALRLSPHALGAGVFDGPQVFIGLFVITGIRLDRFSKANGGLLRLASLQEHDSKVVIGLRSICAFPERVIGLLIAPKF